MRRALFVDRDGVLIVDTGYLSDPHSVELTPWAVDLLRCAASHGLAVIVISNQSGVGRGLISPEQARAVHERMVVLLAGDRVALDGAYYCFHTPEDRCRCRKPGTELVEQACGEHDIDPARSWFIGDRASDIECGRAAGCRTIALVPVPGADHVIDGPMVPALLEEVLDACAST